MSFIEAVKSCLAGYVKFSGRASRSEYWWFVLFYFLVALVSAFLGHIISGLVALALFLPSLAVAVRRLHDIGKSGWWILIGFVPLVGWLILLYFAVQPSQDGANDYGQAAQAA